MSKELTMQEAIVEAKRCLNCSRPLCRTGCPIDNNIPAFIRALSEGNIGQAYETIAERSNLPAICGRVCAHEKQCEEHCVLNKKNAALAIGSLEMFIADFAHQHGLNPLPPSTGKRGLVAIIGSGPAGLTVAGDLAKMDFGVTIFEGQPEPGGVLLFGIPEFRLEKDVVRREIRNLQALGVEIVTSTLVGVDFTLDDLFSKGFDAIFMGTGT
ncbi:MAG: NAD(P)-binding protein, partial [Acidaminococcaceae bacterium]